MRWIAHVDMDSFYVSVERLKNPGLIGKPVAVGGPGSRGVIASSSYEARRFGVRSAMPTAQARRLCRELIVVEPQFSSYSSISRKVFDALGTLAPIVEQVSVDEAYLDFTGCERLYSSWKESGERVKDLVKNVSGLTCTAGLASNKLVAKIASDTAKPDGLLVVLPGTEKAFLHPLSIRKIPGMGQKTSLIFESRGCKTCGDLQDMDQRKVFDLFGDQGLSFRRMAFGQDDSLVSSEGERKSLSSEETFEKDIGSLPILFEYIRKMSEDLATSVREEKLLASTIQIKFRYEDFTTLTRAMTLKAPTFKAKEIYSAATFLLEKNKDPVKKLRLLGVGLKNFVQGEAAQAEQFSLFESPEKRIKEKKIEEVKDVLKKKFGSKILR